MTRPIVLSTLAAAAVLHGCACDTVPDGAITECETTAVFAGHVKTDILFVIDDSLSMDGEQTLLRDALAAFIDALAASPVQNEFQIGVTTTSVEGFWNGGNPVVQLYPNASPSPDGTPYPDGALVANDATVDSANVATWGDFLWTPDPAAADPGFYGASRIMPWSSATLSDDFKRNVLVGTDGSGREQPFEAMRLALTTQIDPATGENVGFLRPGARLAVIFISDEDDCSGPPDASVANSADCRAQKTAPSSVLTPVAEYADFLNGEIAGEVRDTVVAVIAGVAPGTLVPSCGSSTTCADTTCSTATDKADRFIALIGGMASARTRLASICDASFNDALEGFASAIMSQTVPLEGAPADWRMLAVTVRHPDGTRIPCSIQLVGAAGAGAADAVYSPASGGNSATLTFQNACALDQGFAIDIEVICAG